MAGPYIDLHDYTKLKAIIEREGWSDANNLLPWFYKCNYLWLSKKLKVSPLNSITIYCTYNIDIITLLHITNCECPCKNQPSSHKN